MFLGLETLAINFILLIAIMLVLWLISIRIGDVSFVDSFWAAGFVIVAWATFWIAGPVFTEHRLLLVVITSLWGLRLAAYLFWRWRKEGPDGHYVAMLKKAPGSPHVFSLQKVFLLQGVLLWVVSLPIQLGQIAADGTPATIGPLAIAGIVLAVIGIVFESVGDWQMARFKADPDNEGQVMDRGLWRYTRHPNYFGDCCVWWGLFLIAAETPLGLYSIVGPLLLTFLLVKWSGAALLERRMKRSRPGYQDYIQRTSSFIPWFPRKTI